MIIIMGDFNAKVCKEQDPLNITVGPHGLGEHNERVTCGQSGAQHITNDTKHLVSTSSGVSIHMEESRRWYQKSD